MPALQSQLQALAATFVNSVVDAIRSASLEELVAGGGTSTGNPRRGRRAGGGGGGQPDPLATAPTARKGKGGRLKRRSSEDLAAALGEVVALLKKGKDGLRSEEIRAALKMESKEMPRVLREGLSTKMLSKKGQKRATTYVAR
jgi:hypothetical protein